MSNAFLWLLSISLTAALVRGAGVASGAVFTVTNTGNGGTGSLAQAILDVNAASTPSEIAFNIPGAGVHTIRPTAALPTITKPVAIKGYTQPGSHPNTLIQGDDAAIMIEIDGRGFPNTPGLFFDTTQGGNSVSGLSIFGFKSKCLLFRLCDGNVVAGNFLGTDAGGVNAPDNGGGIYFNNCFSNKIGSSNPADRNIICGGRSGGIGTGIEFYGAVNPFNPPTVHTFIQGNYIGTDKTGTVNRGNAGYGIAVSEPMVTIGGTQPGEGNIIAYNAYAFNYNAGRAKGLFILGNSVFGNTLSAFEYPQAGPVTITGGVAGGTNVSGTVKGDPGVSQRIEIFENDVCAANGIGQGKTFLGFGSATPDANGSAPFVASLAVPLNAGKYLTATATPNDPEGATLDYSLCYQVPAGPPLPPLSIARQGSQVLLTWPSTATGFTLQWSESLEGPWQIAPNQGVVTGGMFQSNDIIIAPRKFYRLAN